MNPHTMKIPIVDNSVILLIWADYSPQLCHAYAKENFNSYKMVVEYIKKYEIVLIGATLNSIAPQLKPKLSIRLCNERK